MRTIRKVYTRSVSAGVYGTICLPFTAKPGQNVSVYQVAGRDRKNRTIFVEPVEIMEAGIAYIYKSHSNQIRFYRESEGEVSRPKIGQPLMGTFVRCPELDPHSLVLIGDEWYPASASLTVGANCAWLVPLRTPVSTGSLAMRINDRL